MKIAFIYANDVHPKSPMTGSERLSNLIQDSISLSDSNCDYSKLRSDGYKIFCYGHKPSLYKNRVFTSNCLNDIINSRIEWVRQVIGIKCISGFSYWKRYQDSYNCFFPTITTYKRISTPSKICIGYYNRGIRPDTRLEFIKLANTVPLDIDIIIMGTDINLDRPHKYTTNEDEFFSNVTHYFYMKSNYHDDPWPHSLLQACQCGCSIIMPTVNRTWKDGVDDILDVCDFVPISSKYPWEKSLPCKFSPKGEDFVKLYNLISETWRWVPNKNWKNFSDLYNYVIGL